MAQYKKAVYVFLKYMEYINKNFMLAIFFFISFFISVHNMYTKKRRRKERYLAYDLESQGEIYGKTRNFGVSRTRFS